MNAPRIAVVGGGISGMSAAYRLRRLLGQHAVITVVDSAARLGGKLHTVEFAGGAYDVGAEAFLTRRPEATALVKEIGLATELTHPADAKAGIRAGGQTRALPARTVTGIPAAADDVADVLSPAGVRRVAAEAELPQPDLAGADISVGALLRERMGEEVAFRLVDPLLGGVYAGSADSLGLRATMPALAAKLDAGAGSLLAAAAGLLPPPESLLANPNGQPSSGPPVFGTLRGGLGMLIAGLAKASGVLLRLGQPVRAVRRLTRGWRLELGTPSAPEIFDVDAVVLAVPAPAARKLLAGLAPAAATAFGRIELASMAVIALALPADAALPRSSGVLIASGERHAAGTGFTAKAFTYSSRKWAHLGGADQLVVRASVGRHGEVETLRRDDADLVRSVRADLAELTGVRAEPLEAMVTRWGGGLPQYGVGHLDLVDSIERAVTELPGLAVAGAALRGVGLPACIASADAAATRIAAHLAATAQPIR